jgi:hypothetical protein
MESNLQCIRLWATAGNQRFVALGVPSLVNAPYKHSVQSTSLAISLVIA